MRRKVSIIIVDDYLQNVQALSNLIQSDDIEIFEALSAEAALDIFQSKHIDLALFDIQMPSMSGFDLARLVRGVNRYKELPIIFVTAQQETPSLLFEGYDTGAVDVMFKPLNAFIVKSKIKGFVDLINQKHKLTDLAEELNMLRITADSANQAKTQFLANMSHEIRTPLAAVLGFSENLAISGLSISERQKSVEAIRRNSDLLMRLLDDILDLSKIEAGKIIFESSNFDLKQLFEDIESSLSIRARQKGIQLKFDYKSQDEAHTFYFSDNLRIKQVLLNIIGNAIKFTSKGVVQVSLQVTSSDRPKTDWVKVAVKDEGLGLNESQINNLFQPFTQAELSTKRKFGGTGLGLVISRQIARALGGDVRILETAEGKGSTFEISFLLSRSLDTDIEKENNKNQFPTMKLPDDVLKGCRVLAVDDSLDNLALLEIFLAQSGAVLTLATSGDEAIKHYQQEPFDLILMDIQMPNKDGHETTQELRQMGCRLPILALTAHAIKEEQNKCYQSGCDTVMTKPLNKDKLIRLIHTYYQKSKINQ